MYLLGTYNIYGGRIVHKYVFHIYIVKDVSKVIDYFKVGLPYILYVPNKYISSNKTIQQKQQSMTLLFHFIEQNNGTTSICTLKCGS